MSGNRFGTPRRQFLPVLALDQAERLGGVINHLSDKHTKSDQSITLLISISMSCELIPPFGFSSVTISTLLKVLFSTTAWR